MCGSSPSFFHTTPPQPALKARPTLYSLSVGGAEASQNGLGDLMPRNSLRRSAILFLLIRINPSRLRSGERVGPIAKQWEGEGHPVAIRHVTSPLAPNPPSSRRDPCSLPFFSPPPCGEGVGVGVVRSLNP